MTDMENEDEDLLENKVATKKPCRDSPRDPDRLEPLKRYLKQKIV